MIFSFFLVRAIQGEFVVAALDFYFFVGVALGTAHIYRTGKNRKASIFLIFFAYSAIIPVIYLTGIREVNWLFPIMAAAFYMLKPAEALSINTAGLVICLPKIISLWPTTELWLSLLPLILINIFCYMFAKLVWLQKEQLSELALLDPLTGISNRRALSENIDKLLLSQKRKKSVASMISFDVDHFKEINDTYGHLTGDQILVAISSKIKSRIRATDQLYRQGGEEFVIVALDTEKDTALKLAEELRQLIEKSELLKEKTITISFGVAELKNNETQVEWIKRVDSALYEAKISGRNTVRVSA